ncbi:MAG: leucine-rich repeat domain-containing protein [Bacilli bacterium]
MSRKKVKEINGIKIINRYTAATFFSGLFSLLAAAILVCFIFLPGLLLIKDNVVVKNLNGLETLTFLFGQNPDAFNEILAIVPTNYKLYFVIANYVVAGLLVLGLLYSLFLLLYGLKLIIFGKVKHYNWGVNLSGLLFGLVVFLFGILIGELYLANFLNTKFPDVSLGEAPFTSCKIDYVYFYVGTSIVIFLILVTIYRCSFANKVYIGDISKYDFDNRPKVSYTFVANGVEQSSPVVKEVVNNQPPAVVYVNPPVNTNKVSREVAIPNIVPSSKESIGGHAFSQNTNIRIANIPLNVKTIGPGAFSNCLKLEVVSLPASITNIGYNCFFNCYNLKRINYAGTKKQWRRIARGSNWLYKAGTNIVVCTDGPIIVNPLH